MPNLRLTRRSVDEIPHPARGQAIYRDTTLPGFGVRVGAKSKTYIVEGQVNRRTRRVTIGRVDLFPPETARRKALVVLGDMAEGVDPTAEKRKKAVQMITVEKAFKKFFEARPDLANATVENYLRNLVSSGHPF